MSLNDGERRKDNGNKRYDAADRSLGDLVYIITPVAIESTCIISRREECVY